MTPKARIIVRFSITLADRPLGGNFSRIIA